MKTIAIRIGNAIAEGMENPIIYGTVIFIVVLVSISVAGAFSGL